MKTFMLYTGSGPLAILTSFGSVTEGPLLERLKAKGINKFICYEIPTELAKERYGAHFTVVQNDLSETDDLRVLDYNGHRVFQLFTFDELGTPTAYEGG